MSPIQEKHYPSTCLTRSKVKERIAPSLNHLFTYLTFDEKMQGYIAFSLNRDVHEILRDNEQGCFRYAKTSLCPITYKIDRTKNNLKIQIHLPTAHSSIQVLLGKGSFKTVKKTVSIILDTQDEYEVVYMATVVLRERIDKDKNTQERKADSNSIQNGLRIQRMFFNHMRKLNLDPGVPKILNEIEYENENGNSKIEIEQRLYNGNFYQLITKNTLPTEIFKNKVVSFPYLESKFNILTDVCVTLSYLHQSGFQHIDVKCENILIKIDETNTPRGILSDFDLAQKIGALRNFETAYCFHDFAAQKRIALPSNDFFGLIIAATDIFVPSWTSNKEFGKLNLVEKFRLLLSIFITNKPCRYPKDKAHELAKYLKEHAEHLDTLDSVVDYIQKYSEPFYNMSKLSKCILVMREALEAGCNHFEASKSVYLYYNENPELLSKLSDPNERRETAERFKQMFPGLLNAQKTSELIQRWKNLLKGISL